MDIQPKIYSRRRLITVAERANALAFAKAMLIGNEPQPPSESSTASADRTVTLPPADAGAVS